MTPLEEAQAAIWRAIRPVQERETVALEHALGRFLAEPLAARVDHPGFDNSMMDGYAVNAAEARAHDFVLPVVGESSCGSAPRSLAPGTAMRIYTGAPLPAGADTVVIQEDVRLEDGRVHLPRTLAAGENVRYRGEDYRAGEALYAPGRRLTALDIALVASAGVDAVSVCRRPRVLVAATGNELVPPGRALAPGQIYESNRLALALQLRALGAAVEDGGIVRDELAALDALLARAEDYDFIVTSGGASVGDYDLVRQAFSRRGTLTLWKVRIKPGKPLAFGRIGARTHFFVLPGNPVSSVVTYKLIVEPALHVWHHAQPVQWQLRARATAGFRRTPGRTEFLRARLTQDAGRLLAEPLAGQGSHMLGALRYTNGFIRVEADSAGFAAGEEVLVLPLAF
ncbi:MAG TPA: gephyrin-like molybdotransferase Glp [Burkholderiales bacterium]